MSSAAESAWSKAARLRRLLLVLFFLAVTLSAWVHDDAYITLRTVDNVLEGRGLTWNPPERVQAYTHPLWLALLLPLYGAIGSAYWALLGLSLACSVLVFWLLLFRVARGVEAALVAGLALCLSRALVDFSTSGLENPLGHLLLTGLALALLYPREHGGRQLLVLGFLASAGALTRPDAFLLFLPALWLGFRAAGGLGRALPWLGAGLLPLVLWAAFAVAYYGFPFPNTAYAKLGIGVGRVGLLLQGSYYLLDSLERDPVTLVAIGLGLWVAFSGRVSELRPLAVGAGLYLLYLVWIGGGYMSGRFLTLPLVAAVLCLARLPRSRLPRARLLAPAAALLAAWSVVASLRGPVVPMPGVGDERRRFAHATGLVRGLGEETWPDHFWRHRGEALGASGAEVWVHGFVGFLGFYAGPEVHVIDLLGLTDPLLSRLPGLARGEINRPGATLWAPGHVPRPLPAGYWCSRLEGENRIVDPGIASLYRSLTLVTRGPLWERERWREIWRLNTGYYDPAVRAYQRSSEARRPRPERLELWFSTPERPDGGWGAREGAP